MNIAFQKSVRYNVLKEVITMITTNVTTLRKNIFEYFDSVIATNEPVTVTTKTGNAVILSEAEYNGMMETLYLMSVPGLPDSIKEGMNTPLSECVPESEVEW